MPRCTALVLLVVAIVLGSACGVSDLDFVQDDRVEILEPKDRSKVALPVTVRWTADDFDGTFAVFLDRAPVPPGRPLDWLARDDDLCRDTPGCPGPEWFTSRQVFPTAERQLTIDDVPELTRDERRVFHEVTVVLIDDKGERVGESAFSVEFEVERDS